MTPNVVARMAPHTAEAVLYVRGLEQRIVELESPESTTAYMLAYRRGYQAGYQARGRGMNPDPDRARLTGRGPGRVKRTSR
jgi:hypothetical protein